MYNLRCYDKYSLRYSITDIDKIVALAKSDGDSHVIILNKAGLHSTIYVAKAAKKAGLEPMLGYEFREWLTLWPYTHKGLRNLNKIVTQDSKFQVDHYDFTDIIGVLDPSKAIIGANFNNIQELIKTFGQDNLFIEIEEHLAQSVKDFHEKCAADFNLKIIPTAIVLYNEQNDALAHDYFHNYIWKDDKHLPSDTYYLKSTAAFAKWAKPVWIENAKNMAQRIKLDITLGKLRLPEFDGAPPNTTNLDFLHEKCRVALKDKRLSKEWIGSDIYEARLTYELADIASAKLESYFLIVEDICAFTKKSGIKMGLGRGSAAGSLVCYLLGITGIDPIKYNLIWERFYNAGRSGSLPDIDTDFEKARREEVIEYISKRWGEDSVFQIITFGGFGPAKAITVVMNIGQCGFEEQKEISKLVHHKAKTIAEALEKSPELKEEAQRRKALFQIAEKLEGSFESFGKHAAGVIIADEPFTNGGLPMTYHDADHRYISGFDLGAVEDYGLLKIDCLGLNTLDIIKRCEELIQQRHNLKDFRIEDIPLDDQDVYTNIFDKGMTKCIFQLESQLGQKFSKLVKPRSIQEIADLVTIIRPGAMEPGQTQLYLDVRDGKKQAQYVHPLLEKVLKHTYSACIYQEQVLAIAKECAGFTLQEADKLRAIVGKKKKDEMPLQKSLFINGCIKNNITNEVAEKLWTIIEANAGYSFNLAHAVGYAFLSYQTAWLKHHYPVEFFEANCNYVVGDLHRSEFDKLREFIYDAKEYSIDVVLPNIKECNAKFKIMSDKVIKYGLAYIKRVGESQIPIIQKCNNATTFSEFLTQALKEGLKKDVIQALICSGALDHFKLTRNTMLADYELINSLTDREYDAILKESSNILESIYNISDEANIEQRKLNKLVVPNKNRRNKLRDIIQQYKSKDKFESILHIAMYEREYLGCDISVNETEGFFASITHNLAELKKVKSQFNLKIKSAIHIDSIRKIVTKKGKNPGQEMAFITGSDGTAICDSFIVFPKQYNRFKNLLVEGRIIYIDGEISQGGGIIVNNMGILQ